MAKTKSSNKEQLELMREEVLFTEMQARFWKANYDVKHYTLEDARITPEYNAYLQTANEKMMKAMEELEASPDPNLTIESKIISPSKDILIVQPNT